jgi:hypothetical protein
MSSKHPLHPIAKFRSRLTFAILLGTVFAPSALGQEAAPAAAAPQYKVKPIDPERCNDKRTNEKKDLLTPEKFDAGALDSYYRECLFVRMTQPDAESMNRARSELMFDIETVEKKLKGSQESISEFNRVVVRNLKELIAKDQDGKSYHPSARIIAAIAAARLNKQAATPQSGGLADPEGTKILVALLSPTENDGMVATSLSHLPRHWQWPGMDEATLESARVKFVANVQAFLAAQKPTARGPEEDSYLKELMIENLTIIANSKGESAKQALPVLLSLVLPAIKDGKTESEWLVEKSMWSLGQLNLKDQPPEGIAPAEKGAVQFLQASLESWNKRCSQTSSSTAGGYMGMGGKSGGPGGRGGGPPGLGGPGGGGLIGGDDGGGPPGAAGAGAKPKNPFEDQPKEVRNARRILQQRLERIHVGLNGFGKKSSETSTRGLMNLLPETEKGKIQEVLNKIEALQQSLNSDKNTGLSELVTNTRRPIYDLQQALSVIVKDDSSGLLEPPPPETTEGESTEGDGFGSP